MITSILFPFFRNIDSFMKAVKSNRITDLYPPQVEYLSATNNPFDYPSINRTSLELEQDSSVADMLWNKAATEKRRCNNKHNIILYTNSHSATDTKTQAIYL